MSVHTTRRTFVRTLGLGGLGLLAVACAPAAPSAPTGAATAASAPTSPPTQAPAVPKPSAVTATASAAASPSAAAPSPAAKPAASPSVVVNSGAITRGDQVQPLAQRVSARLASSNQSFVLLPLHVAVAKGYFQKAGLDLEVSSQVGFNAALALARGDTEFSYVTPSPPTFNQVSQGFEVQMASSLGGERPGRFTGAWLAVLKEKADQIKELKDLKGTTLEGAIPGSPPDQVIQFALRAGGLKAGEDVKVEYRVKSNPDFLALVNSKGADVFALPEPLVTLLQQEGKVVKWKAAFDFMPWYQGNLLGVSPQFLAKNREAAVKFVEVAIATAREVNATNGEWTPELLNIMAKSADVPPDLVKAQGGAPYYDPNGTISLESLQKTQDLWVELGPIKQPVDLQRLIAPGILDEALARIGRVPA